MTPPAINGHIRTILVTVDAVGGVWRYALDLAAGLEDEDIKIILTGFGPPPTAEQILEIPRNCRLVWLDAPLDWMADDPARLSAIPAMIEEVVRLHDVDLLHLNLPSQAAGLAVAKPVVVVSHSCIPTWFSAVRGTKPPRDWAWHEDLGRRGFNQADLVLVPSRSHAENVRAVYGPLPSLQVVYNASDSVSQAGDKGDVVVAAGRWWDEGKNGAVLDHAARDTVWPILMAGSTSGPNGQHLDIANARPAGECAHSEIMKLMRNAAIFVSPSIYEPFGLAALEAAKSGCALVLADIPTYRELWGGAALFASPRDPSAFAAALNRLAGDESLRERLATQALLRSGTFTRKAQCDAMLDHYRAAARSPRLLTAAE